MPIVATILEVPDTLAKISVLLGDVEEERFTAYCREKGFKKSTLVVRLIREHLDREGYASQRSLELGGNNEATQNSGRPPAKRRRGN
jgi:hypothetical protein